MAAAQDEMESVDGTLGELHFRMNDLAVAKRYFQEAFTLTKSQQEKKLLERKLAKC